MFPHPITINMECAPILLEFCKLVRGVAGVHDALYIFRSILEAMMELYDVRDVIIL